LIRFEISIIRTALISLSAGGVSQADDDISWSLLKPDIFAAVMDFFATDQPVLNKEVESASSDADGGLSGI